MPKVNHFRGETRESVRRDDPGVGGRERHGAIGVRSHRYRPRRGHSGLVRDYRPILTQVGVHDWCPCCIDWFWRRHARERATREKGRRVVHRALRRENRRLCLEGFADYLDDE